MVLEPNSLEQFDPSAREALERASDRLDRSWAARDVEGTIGAAKELVESSAKVVIDAVGGPAYGSQASLPELAGKATTALKLHPSGLQGRGALQRLSQSVMSMVQALAELRNSDGTGHGRSEPSELVESHAALARHAAIACAQWLLDAAARVIAGQTVVEDAAQRIRYEVFRRGELPSLLNEVQLASLDPQDQLRLGTAVARRWTTGQTFLALEDVIQPIAEDSAEYPASFKVGMVIGLVLDHDGNARTTPSEIDLAVEIVERLQPSDREEALSALESALANATSSYAFDEEATQTAAARLRERAEGSVAAAHLERIATRLEELAPKQY